MFGHHDDVITEDQKDDAKVTIPDSDLSAIASADDNVPIIDNGQAPVAPPADDQSDEAPTPPLATTSVDGFSAPNAKLSSPFDYMQDSESRAVNSSPASRPYLQDSDRVSPSPEEKEEVATVLPTSPKPDPQNEVTSDLPVKMEDEPKPLAQTFGQPLANTDDDAQTNDVPEKDEKQSVTNKPSEKLLSIKEEALGELSPLINRLELTPENKFQTLMMLIHESDNDKLIADAYAAAKTIKDEKVRAQAYLDIVNEINYFTGE